MSESTEILKCLIVGSGPAGYTAAIYAARANLKPVMVTGEQPGGQLMITTDVENYPGYPKGIHGPKMMEDFKEQAERFGTNIILGKATKVDFTGPVHKVWVDDKTLIQAHTIILATGAEAKYLGIPSETRLRPLGGVSACAVCDGFFYKGKEVALVGAGDTACEEAVYLSNLCSNVHMIVRSDKMRASKIMQERVFKQKNIHVYWNT
ncbi:MAG: FAD-dependent oxidoreductase, partial [Bacteroidia bacterium]|nr:FAD-dependent oxidoreductase [Bacteroidia bacterium]